MTFSVHLSGAVGELKADLSTPSGGEEDVFVTDLDDEKYALRFVPKENGVYYVSVRLNEAHIPGSPIPILIGKHGADPALVFARGQGLEKGQVGWCWSITRLLPTLSLRAALASSGGGGGDGGGGGGGGSSSINTVVVVVVVVVVVE